MSTLTQTTIAVQDGYYVPGGKVAHPLLEETPGFVVVEGHASWEAWGGIRRYRRTFRLRFGVFPNARFWVVHQQVPSERSCVMWT